MEFREERNGDFSLIPSSAADFRRFLGLPARRKREHLFRFSRVSPHLLGSLRKGYLWMSKPGDLNDPFDSKVFLNYTLSAEQLRQHVVVRRNQAPSAGTSPRSITGVGRYRSVSRFALGEDSLRLDSPESINTLLNLAKFAERSRYLDKALGVCCFTEDSESLLMWAHYADRHRGVCLRFRHRKSEDFAEYCFPVQYRSSVWTCRCGPADVITQSRALFRGLLLKSRHWRYEREWRRISFGSGESSFQRSDLDGVILGINVTRADKKDVLSLLRRHGYSHVEILQARQHIRRYGVCIARL